MYKSPIDLIYDHLVTEQENEVFKAVVRCGVDVDKDELIKALAYDRRQYDLGYADGKMDANAEPHWILTGDAEPEHCHMVLISVFNAKTDMRFVDTGALYSDGWYGSGWKLPDYCIVTAWQELPKPYEVEE